MRESVRKKKNILIINKFYAPHVGGVETVVRQYAHWLAGIYSVTVLVISSRRTFRTSIESDGRIRVIRCSSMGTYLSMPLSLSFFYWYLRLSGWADVVHFSEPFPLASILAILPKGRRRYVVSWYADIYRQRYLRELIRVFQNALCRKADAITASSPLMLRSSVTLRHHADKTAIIPYSIDVPVYDDGTSDGRMPGIPAEPFALCVGRLSYYKGIDVLLRSYESIKSDMTLVVVGSGPESDRVADWERSNKPHRLVFVNRHVSEAEKRELLRRCEFLVFPSTSPAEAFGIIQLEAMVCSKPVINTALHTSVPWVSLHDETGLTVPVADSKKLTDAMLRLGRDESLRKRMGARARQRVLSLFSDEKCRDLLQSLYAELLS